MTDATICDRCGNATDKRTRVSGLRADVEVKHLDGAATAHSRLDYNLCESCTEALHLWMDVDLPRKYRKRSGYEEAADD